MKKQVKFFISIIMTSALVLSGCSLSNEEPQEATEYVNDSATEAESTDSAAEDNSTVVVKDLFEPILEAVENDASSEASSSDAATEAASIKHDEVVEIVFMGDSQFANGKDDATDISALVMNRVPNCIPYNLAIGGTTCSLEKTTSEASPENMHSTSFLGMANALASRSDREATLAQYPNILEKMNMINTEDVDYYIIEYGANDFINEVPLDVSMYESEADQAHAYYNAYKKGIEILQSISPNAQIIIVSPFYGIYVDASGTYVGDSYIVSNGIGTLADYAKKAQNVAEDVQATFVDTMFRTHCDLYLDTASEYLMDNLHLSLKGRQVFSRIIAHYINFAEHNEPYAYLETDVIKISEFNPDEYYRYDEGQMKEYYPESWEKYIKGEFPLAQPSEEALAEYNASQGN